MRRDQRDEKDQRDLGTSVPLGPSVPSGFIPPHGGYQKLLSYQKAQIVYDATVYFCNRFLEKRDRTHDQMVQAARSGKQNIVEGSQVSGTSKELELKLTNIARASLEELLTDYRDFLRCAGCRNGDRTARTRNACANSTARPAPTMTRSAGGSSTKTRRFVRT